MEGASGYEAKAQEWLLANGGSVYNVLEWGGGFEVDASNHSPPETDPRPVIKALAALLESVSREAAESMRERAAVAADEHRERAKAMQAALLERRDPVYGLSSVDDAEWDRHQRAAGCATAIATAIRALPLSGEDPE